MKNIYAVKVFIFIFCPLIGICMSEVLFYPTKGNFLYDYQTLVGGLLAFLTVYIALNHKNKINALKQQNIKRIFEIELYPISSGVGFMYQNLKDKENASKEDVLEQVEYWCSELPSVMYDNGLISELHPKDMLAIISMRGHYQQLINSSKSISARSDEDLKGTTYIRYLIFCALAFSSTFDRFSEKVVTKRNQDGSETKWLDIR